MEAPGACLRKHDCVPADTLSLGCGSAQPVREVEGTLSRQNNGL